MKAVQSGTVQEVSESGKCMDLLFSATILLLQTHKDQAGACTTLATMQIGLCVLLAARVAQVLLICEQLCCLAEAGRVSYSSTASANRSCRALLMNQRTLARASCGFGGCSGQLTLQRERERDRAYEKDSYGTCVYGGMRAMTCCECTAVSRRDPR